MLQFLSRNDENSFSRVNMINMKKYFQGKIRTYVQLRIVFESYQ